MVEATMATPILLPALPALPGECLSEGTGWEPLLELDLVDAQIDAQKELSSMDLTPGGGELGGTLPRGPHKLTRKQVGDDQKRRLIEAMLAEVSETGYAQSNVAQLIARAQVSRKTFYVHFASREDLLLSTFDTASAWMVEQIAKASTRSGGSTRRLEATLRRLARCALESPGTIGLCTIDVSAAHATGFARRQELLNTVGQLLEDCLTTEHQPAVLPPLLPQSIAGGTFRMLDAALRADRADTLTTDALELARWVRGYHPAPQVIGRAGRDQSSPHQPMQNICGSGRAPGTLTVVPSAYSPPPRRVSRGEQAHINRERILDAVARLVAEHGYTQLTAQSIAANAGLPERAFLSQYANKSEAFMSACELGHTKAQAIVARAREGAATWRTGVQDAIVGLFDFFSAEPLYANLALIAAPLASPQMARRHNQQVSAYARLLFHDAPQRRRPPKLAGLAITHALLEIVYAHAGKNRLSQLLETLSQATYLALAPYLGTTEATKHALD